MKRVGWGSRSIRAVLVVAMLLSVHAPLASASASESARVSSAVVGTLTPRATSLTLASSSGAAGTPAQISGSLVDELGNGVPGATVSLESGLYGTSWTADGTVTTDSEGAFSTTRLLTRTTYFRAGYAGAAADLAPCSVVATVGFTPSVAWVKIPPATVAPGQKFAIKALAVPAHGDSACAGTFRFERLESEQWVERKAVAVRGALNASTGTMEFAVSTSLPTSGDWRARLDLAADSAHDRAASETQELSVGVTKLAIYGKPTIAPGADAKLDGTLKNAVNGHGISGKSIRIDSSIDGEAWTKAGSAKTDRYGQFEFHPRPKSAHYYRFVFPGTSGWITSTSKSLLVQTIFTLKGSSPGHFKAKKVWMTAGVRKIRLRIEGKSQSVTIDTQDDLEHLLLADRPGTYEGTIDFSSSTYCHFKIVGKGFFKIQVWN